MSVGPVTAAKWNQPPIPLLDPATNKKIKLRLRTMSFSREIQDLPTDMLEVHSLLIEQRANRNASIYAMVAAWNKLRIHERYWTSFKFASEPEYLAYYGLPDGTTLAGWTVMVNLFDKPTFVLLGDEVLSYMTRAIGEYQDDTDERKKDYQAIFDQYCTARHSFDKTAFYDTIRNYVAKKYEKPQAQAEAISIEAWRQKRDLASHGHTRRRKVIPALKDATDQRYGPKVDKDFAWEKEACSGCSAKLELLTTYEQHLIKLEEVIRKKLGARQVPKRPALIDKK